MAQTQKLANRNTIRHNVIRTVLNQVLFEGYGNK